MTQRNEFYENLAKDVHNSLVRAVNLTTALRRTVAIEAVEYLAGDIAFSLKVANSSFRFETFFEACGLDRFGKFPKEVIPRGKRNN